MPRGFMDDLEGEFIDEEFYECGLGEDIFSADLYCEDALLLNIGKHCVTEELSSKQHIAAARKRMALTNHPL